MELVRKAEQTNAEVERSLTLYVTETDPSPIERRSLRRWILLALLVLVLHILAFYFAPRWFPPAPPAPIEVQQIDPAKLAAVKQRWKERGFLLDKNPNRPKEKVPEPKNARYESDRNQAVAKEMRARQTNVIPNVSGDANSKADVDKKATHENHPKNVSKIPLANLSNFRGLPVPGMRPEEERAEQLKHGGPGETGDQALNDRTVPEGAENMLNTVESVYYSFYSRIYEQIGPLWQSLLNEKAARKRPAPGEYMTEAEVIFDSDGNFTEARILRSSGNTDFDNAVPESWKKIPRFPNPPRGLIQPDGKIHMAWTFTVRVDDHMQWQSMPPERNY